MTPEQRARLERSVGDVRAALAAADRAPAGTEAIEPTGRVHDLKVWPSYFVALLDGSKTFELRRNDRDYQIGDELLLREWDPITSEYSGRSLRRTVSYVLTDDHPAGLGPGYAALALVAPSGAQTHHVPDAGQLIAEGAPGGWREGYVLVPRMPDRASFDKLAHLWGYNDEETAETLGTILDVFDLAAPEPLEEGEADAQEIEALNTYAKNLQAANKRLREALEWYRDQARDCPKITPEGVLARSRLDKDRGRKANAALTEAGHG